MSIPKTTKLTLKRIVEGIKDGTLPDNGFGKEVERLTPDQKKKLMQMSSMWENFGECLKNEESLMNSAKGITELCELAETYALNECPDVFQRNIVERDMKEVKKRVMEFQKITKEAYARMQQLGVAYQDIGHVLGRYYDLKSAKKLDNQYQTPGGAKVMDEGDTICSWCNPESPSRVMQKNSIQGKHDSHGICKSCKEKFFGDSPEHGADIFKKSSTSSQKPSKS